MRSRSSSCSKVGGVVGGGGGVHAWVGSMLNPEVELLPLWNCMGFPYPICPIIGWPIQGLKGIGGVGGTLDLPVSTKLTTVNIWAIAIERMARIALSAGASVKSGCSINTMLYENSTVTRTRIKQNVFRINALVSMSTCSGVLCAIFRFIKKFGTILRSNAKRGLAIFRIPVLRVLAMVAISVFTRHQQKS